MKLKKGFWLTEDGRKAKVVDIKHGFAIGWVGDSAVQWRIDGTCLTLSFFNLVGPWLVRKVRS